MKDTSVYVHFPWCAKKCPYCDFATTKRAATDIPHEAYADALIAELATRGSYEDRRLYSIFFGGGTPSLWAPEALGRVLEGIRAAFPAEHPSLEISVECNPNSLHRQGIAGLRAAGVNRLSIGVQSLRNDQLAYLGRLHDRAEALDAIAAARGVFDRVSADLMFGMPGQRTHVEELDAVIATGVSHVSAYALTIEPGTQFGERFRLGKLQVSTDETYAQLFEETEAHFAAQGFNHYEVSNYAQAHQQCEHNLHYWRGGDYLGLGAAAVGCLSGSTDATRYKNHLDAERYMAAPGGALAEEEHLDSNARIQEALMLGLRTEEGVDLASLERRVGKAPLEGRTQALEKHREAGRLVLDGEQLFVPRSHWLLLDGIVADLF